MQQFVRRRSEWSRARRVVVVLLALAVVVTAYEPTDTSPIED
ncbi:MAG TPA: hypothetical protein VJM33_07670 [Microthrixaceae bacterium]|nr:hypothetical protein [Microthrixaceae bacterium]